MLSIQVSYRHLINALAWVILVSFVFLFLTGFAHYVYRAKVFTDDGSLYLSSLFNLSNENTVATWFSAMLLFVTGLFACLCYKAASPSRHSIFQHGWLVMAFVFFLMSLDEMGSIHENAGKLTFLDVFGDRGWQSVAAIPLGIIFIYMILFAWFSLRKSPATFCFLVLGSVLFLSIPVQEHFEMQMWSVVNYSPEWERPLLYIFLEEGAELFASVSFLAAMILQIKSCQGSHPNISVSFQSHSRTQSALWVASLVFTSLPILFFMIRGELNSDEGIALNWFPSALSTLLGLIALITINGKRGAVVFAVFTIISIYFGADFYHVILWSEIATIRLLLTSLIIVGVGITMIVLLQQTMYDSLFMCAVSLWACTIIVSLFFENSVVAFGAYIASMLVLLSYIRVITNEQMKVPRTSPVGHTITPRS